MDETVDVEIFVVGFEISITLAIRSGKMRYRIKGRHRRKETLEISALDVGLMGIGLVLVAHLNIL